MVNILVGTLVRKEKTEEDLARVLDPDIGIIYQDLLGAQRFAFAGDLVINLLELIEEGQKDIGQSVVFEDIPLSTSVPSPAFLLPKLGRLLARTTAKQLIRRLPELIQDIIQQIPLDAPKPSHLDQIISSDAVVRVYVAKDVDFILVELFGVILDFLELNSLPQPAHAPRRVKKVSSRN